MTIQEAYKAHQAGQYDLAEKAYTALLNKNPMHADILHLLGTLKKQKKEFPQAIQFIKQATLIAPDSAIYHYNLGLAYHGNNNYQKAIKAWEQVLQLDPNYTDAYANIGYTYTRLKEYPKAQQILSQGLTINPNHRLMLLNLAGAWHLDDNFQNATQCYKKLLSLEPDHHDALLGYGRLLYKTGQLYQAIDCLLHLINIQPDCIEGWYQLGCAYQDSGSDSDATICFNQIVSLDPNGVKAYYNLGKIKAAKGMLSSARQLYKAALDINPDFAQAMVVLGLLYLDMADLNNAQKMIQNAMKSTDKLSSHDDSLQIGSIHLYSLNFSSYISRPQVLELHQKWGNNIISHRDYQFCHDSPRKTQKKLRIGYVSPDFRVHSVAYFILPILKHHDSHQFQIYLYANVGRTDHITELCRSYCHVYRNIWGMGTQTAARLIYEDQLDILVDLAGHTHHNRLDIFAMKPSPIQLSYIGYPNTTGLNTMDYRITDTITDPDKNEDRFYTEKLIRIPPPFICYSPPENSPKISDLPMITNGYITFGSFNYLGKINECVIELWAALLKQIPDARLFLKSRPLHDPEVCRQFKDRFQSKGISENRLNFRGSVAGLNNHLNQYNKMDIALDPFPYNGTTTTCEALWMGVPVLTITGDSHAGRVGTTLLTSLGLTDWISQNKTQFIQKAGLFAKHPQLLSALRHCLRMQMEKSDLCNAELHTQKLETIYTKIAYKSFTPKKQHFY